MSAGLSRELPLEVDARLFAVVIRDGRKQKIFHRYADAKTARTVTRSLRKHGLDAHLRHLTTYNESTEGAA